MIVSRESLLAAYGFHVFGLLRCEFGVQQQARHADNGVHGCANLVAHAGQEFALGAGGGLCRFLRLPGALLALRQQVLVPLEFAHIVQADDVPQSCTAWVAQAGGAQVNKAAAFQFHAY